jgi:ABC-type sugar transport system ATPase subunit
MVGRVINQFFIKTNEPTQEKILEVKNLSVESIIRNINFYVRKGEILGIAGLVGAKRSELIRAIFGLSDTLEGQIIYKNSKINNKRPSDALRLKIGYVPEDRKEQGLVLIQPVNRNMTYPILKHFIDFGYIREKARNKKVFETLKKIGFKIEYMKMNVGRLSGGNQQKILIGRYLLADCDLLLLDEPTRGIDVGSKKEIYGLINEFVESGKAVVLVSSEMEEIINMSDRIVVMKEGRITAEFNDRQQFDQEKIMTAMLEEVK